MYWIFFVLPKLEYLNDLMAAWQEAGVTGITILPSLGMVGWQAKNALREDMPLFPGVEDFREHKEATNRTMFTLVENEELVDKVVAATQRVVGDLNQPYSGVLAVIPVARVYGIKQHNSKPSANSPTTTTDNDPGQS